MKNLFLILCFPFIQLSHADSHQPFELNKQWMDLIRSVAPAHGMVQPNQQRTVLIFSLSTGFQHWVVPHTEAVVRILGDASGAYRSHASNDILQFLPENLSKYDTVVLNNNCPDREDRDIFLDVLVHKVDEHGSKFSNLPLEDRRKLAGKLFTSLMQYVENGGGLVLLHGAIANFNYNDDFSEMVGGSFDFHPKQQEVTLNLVDPEHPLLKPFEGEPLVTYDEPYMFNRAYSELDFLPLLEMDVSSLSGEKTFEKIKSLPRYTAWIRPHGKGRVFFTSPSHNAQDFENPKLLEFMLGGIQYALGDLDCQDHRD